MMKYNFDLEIPRQGSSSVKWEFTYENNRLRHLGKDSAEDGKRPLLNLWVADMDFACPAPVVEALKSRVDKGVYGYSAATPAFYDSVVRWMKRRHGWAIDPDWIRITPGIVSGLNLLVRAFADKNSKVLLQPPVYPPFYKAIENNAGGWVANPLIFENGRYRMDFDHLERVTADPQVTMALLCSPHNPVGRVWTAEELTQFGEICHKNGVLVVADEIHGDLVFEGQTFEPFGKLDGDFVARSIICAAPSKTFNLAGLKTSNIIIPDEALRSSFEITLEQNALYGLNPFGTAAVVAAYRHGDEWLEAVKQYLAENLRYLDDFIRDQMPQIKVICPEGTYLVWLDCRQLGVHSTELDRFMREQVRVLLDDGSIFGPEGEGFQRLNIACPRSILADALQRMKQAVDAMRDAAAPV